MANLRDKTGGVQHVPKTRKPKSNDTSKKGDKK